MSRSPLLIEFIAGTRVRREAEFSSALPILGNGPPGTFVMFPDGRQVPLPTDQIVESSDAAGAASVGFGGMRFDGSEGGQLVFRRVRDLLPLEQLSPERGTRMTLEPWMVAAILVDGERAWPLKESLH